MPPTHWIIAFLQRLRDLPKGTWTETTIAFSATFLGVILGFFAAEHQSNRASEKNFLILRKVAIDECYDVYRELDTAHWDWLEKGPGFISNRYHPIFLLRSMPYPVIFLDALEKNVEFVTRLKPETYELLLPERHKIAQSISSYNYTVAEIERFSSFVKSFPPSNPDLSKSADFQIRSDVEYAIETINAARNQLYFGCLALALDQCENDTQFQEFHTGYWNDEIEIIGGSQPFLDCDALHDSLEYSPLEEGESSEPS